MAQYDEQISLLRATTRLYDWQHFASNLMLWTTVGVVVSGILMAAYQLYFSVRLDRSKSGELEISATQLKISSAVVGMVILAMSIAFVLIVVDKVYTIQPSTPPAVTPPLPSGPRP